MRNSPDALLIFAAGFGTRMGALTAKCPKPLVNVAGRPLIDHAIALTEPLGIRKRVANLHYLPHILENHLQGRDIQTITEMPDILETGGGLRNALPLLGKNPVFTLNSDAVWSGPNPLETLQKEWNPNTMDALLMCVPPERALGHRGKGDFTLEGTRASRGAGLIYTGAQIIKTKLLEEIPERSFSLNLLWDKYLARGTLHALSYAGRWCDVGSPEGIKLAEGLLGNDV